MRFVDSHAHLDGEHFADVEPFLQRARAAGITDIVCIGASSGFESNPRTLDLVSRHEGLTATVGIHPHDAKVATDEVVEKIRDLSNHTKVVGIGEIGLDYHYDLSPRDQQRAVFARFLGLGLNKPVVIHTREAEEDTVAILRDSNVRRGVIHCFTGTEYLAQNALDLGFYISFSGVLTFRNADRLRSIARGLPRDRVLVETDCPFLAPVPMRGKENEPAFIVHTAGCLAKEWEVDLSEVKRTTGANAVRLFGL